MSGPLVLGLRILLTVSLYAFLGWAFLSLWRDIRLQGSLLSTRKIPPISLTIAHGTALPQVRNFAQAEVTIGRDPACECQANDEAISARHAKLSYHHNQWWVEDLQSTNGTFLNDDRIYTPTVIISGDELRCGKINLLLTISEKAEAPFKKK